MKNFKWILILFIGTGFAFFSCRKHKSTTFLSPPHPLPPIDYNNVYLRDKPLDTIRKAIKGRWQLLYDSTLGWVGWTQTFYYNDYISFLSNDTVKREQDGVTTIYEKARIDRVLSYGGDTVYRFWFGDYVYGFAWAMTEIHNDTLKTEEKPRYFTLIRKP